MRSRINDNLVRIDVRPQPLPASLLPLSRPQDNGYRHALLRWLRGSVHDRQDWLGWYPWRGHRATVLDRFELVFGTRQKVQDVNNGRLFFFSYAQVASVVTTSCWKLSIDCHRRSLLVPPHLFLFLIYTPTCSVLTFEHRRNIHFFFFRAHHRDLSFRHFVRHSSAHYIRPKPHPTMQNV